jgi:hypothetical protein
MSNTRLILTISEPWELGEALKWLAIRGDLLRMVNNERGGQALIKLDEPFEHRGTVCYYLIASPRHAGFEMARLLAGETVLCSVTGTAEQPAEPSKSLDLSLWRGGIAFIGDVKLETDGKQKELGANVDVPPTTE